MNACWLEVNWRVVREFAGSGGLPEGEYLGDFGGGRLKGERRILRRPALPTPP